MWRRTTSRRLPPRASDSNARWLLDAVTELLAASRRSSEAVLDALARAVRTLDERLDGVVVFRPAGNDLACAYADGPRVEHFRRLALAREDRRLPAHAARAGCRAVLPADGTALSPTDRFAVAAPMLDGETLLAVAYVSSTERLCESLGDALVLAIERAAAPYAIALERETERADVRHDALTGLLSPNAFRHVLRDEIASAQAAQARRVLCLWFVDTDRFKDVNDRFGHRAGDAVLQTMGSLLQSHLIPDVDFAARNGGDEFCALLRGSSKSRAIERARVFCDAIRLHDFGIDVPVTASVGIATYPRDASSASALLETADAAMYHSKRCGRDRVSFAVPSGAFASLRSEAARQLSRSQSRCRSHSGESSAQRWSP